MKPSPLSATLNPLPPAPLPPSPLHDWPLALCGVRVALQGDEMLAQLHKEIDLCERLSHPNVVRVFGFCPKPDLAVVMEYIVGGSLSQWIASTRDKVSIVVSVLLHL